MNDAPTITIRDDLLIVNLTNNESFELKVSLP